MSLTDIGLIQVRRTVSPPDDVGGDINDFRAIDHCPDEPGMHNQFLEKG
jgi:hypothetical protein